MKKMLIVCDIEGTIFQAKYKIQGTDYASSMWQPIAHALGSKAENDEFETHLKWKNKEYENYIDWVKATVAIHKKYKLRKETFQRLIDEAEYMPGVVEFFKKLDREKFIPVFITGGFMELARRAKNELKVDSADIYAACNYIFDAYGNLVDVDIKSSDFDDKITCVKEKLDFYGLSIDEDWIFIGDGKNDVYIAEMAPYSFGINAHKELKKVVAQPIDNFMEAFEDINAFYDIINTAKGSTAHQRKILEIRANRQRQRERLVEENLEMRQQIEELKKRIDILENTIPKPTTVEAIIPFAEYYYGENISFSKEARSSLIKNAAAGYTQRYIEGVFEQLNYINTWAKYMKKEISKEEYDSIVNNKKITYALSESTEAKFREEYTDSGVLINMHMYMRSLPNCDRPRTYFGWDKKHNKVLISTMCEHKKTSKYNK